MKLAKLAVLRFWETKVLLFVKFSLYEGCSIFIIVFGFFITNLKLCVERLDIDTKTI
jgi:hypothetical protein